jgi:hypothetical protein
MKNVHLRRYPHSSTLRRTSMYDSLLGISGALHLDVFDQPAKKVFFCYLDPREIGGSDLVENTMGFVNSFAKSLQ